MTPTFTAESPTAVLIEPTVTAVGEPLPTLGMKAEPGAPGVGDSLYPHLGNAGYDVQHYTLDLIVHDVATSDLDGTTRIEARATQNLSSFNLDFVGFEITNLRVNEQSAEYQRSRQELTITPSTPLAQQESFTVEIQYQGSPGEMDSIAIPIQTGWIAFDGGSFVLSEPDGAASFYPVNDHPLDKASYTFRVTVPEPYEVAANGVLTETIDNGDTTTFLFEAPNPMASYLATINIDEFDVETSESGSGIPIRNYYPTGSPEALRQPFARQGEMIDYFSDLFGAYPFEVYGALVIDLEFGAALETQTLSIFSKAMIDANQPEGSEQVVAHELAHQWFGDSVSLGDWSDIWLNESFATYAQGLWTEHTQGGAALDDWVRRTYTFVREERESMSPPGEPPADRLFNQGVYSWGALCLHALRLEVGDETFFDILKTYHERFADGNARTADFIAVAEEVSGKELSAFFDSWLYSEELAPIPAMGLEAK
ncbi:MAG TPA: M1 family metallopeptidase [Anaerolineales bacterium]|nr:M1 family metallopeptidase [Anaerolineales bacterium]